MIPHFQEVLIFIGSRIWPKKGSALGGTRDRRARCLEKRPVMAQSGRFAPLNSSTSSNFDKAGSSAKLRLKIEFTFDVRIVFSEE